MQQPIMYWKAGKKPARRTGVVDYRLPGGQHLAGLSLSPAPTGVELVLESLGTQYVVVVRDEKNTTNAPVFAVASWADDPADVWARVDEVLRTTLVIRSAYARGRSRDDRFTAMCDLLAAMTARGNIADWAVDLDVGDGFWTKTTGGVEESNTLDVLWDMLAQDGVLTVAPLNS